LIINKRVGAVAITKVMQKKVIKYSISILLLTFLGYNSIYFKKLDEVRAASSSNTFDAPAYARNFYSKLNPGLDSAVHLNKLIILLQTSPGKAFDDYSHALTIGNIRYFMVQGEALISSIDEDAIMLMPTDSTAKTVIKLATEFVYGNAIRDASGLVMLNEFSNTADFNKVSEEINKIVRREVLPAFKEKAKKGSVVKFSGALELNRSHLDLDSIEIIPVQLKIVE
jgi:hypothetical protein